MDISSMVRPSSRILRALPADFYRIEFCLHHLKLWADRSEAQSPFTFIWLKGRQYQFPAAAFYKGLAYRKTGIKQICFCPVRSLDR